MQSAKHSLTIAMLLAAIGIAYGLYEPIAASTSNRAKPQASSQRQHSQDLMATVTLQRRENPTEQQLATIPSHSEPSAGSRSRAKPAAYAIPADSAGNNALRTAFDNETDDPHWSATMESNLANLANQLQAKIAPGSNFENIDCRTSVCRVSVWHDSLEKEMAFIATFAATGQFFQDNERGFYQSSIMPDGSIRTEFYHARLSGLAIK